MIQHSQKLLALHANLNQSHKALNSKTTDSHHLISLPAQKNFFYKLLRHPKCMPYIRYIVLIVSLNFFYFVHLLNGTPPLKHNISPSTINTLVLLNFSVAILIRQQYVINLLFKIATSVPTSWPLSIRWAAGKVYHFGGLHAGGFFSGTLWLFLFAMSIHNIESSTLSIIHTLVTFHLLILLTMAVASLPPLRSKHHNAFEIIARFGHWSSLFLFWIQTVLFLTYTNSGSLTYTIILSSPHIWVLGLLSFSTLLPWLYLKKVPINIMTPSNHVSLASFDYGVTPFAGSSTELSTNPLLEWHSFANVPWPDKNGFRLTISRAGDWTGRLIDQKPKHIWTKGIPTAGVGNIELLFKKVIWVATGSGIGPCLPHLLANKVPSQLVWSTRTPEKTYGKDLVDEILNTQPNAVIWNTTKHGKPDLVSLAYQAYREFDAEAVICISNKKVTWDVVYQMESRGIPAFGAIWDS